MKVYFDSLYEHIGLLFYAVASERGKPDPAGYLSLKHLVGEDWGLPSEEPVPIEGYLARHLYSGMKSAFENSISAESAFDSFRDYYQVHAISFGDALKAKIMATVHSIATEFPLIAPGTGMLKRLEVLFDHKREYSSR